MVLTHSKTLTRPMFQLQLLIISVDWFPSVGASMRHSIPIDIYDLKSKMDGYRFT